MRRVRLTGNLYRPIVPAGAARITRGTRWGNPFPVAIYGRDRALDLYRGWLGGDQAAIDEVRTAGCRLRLYGPALLTAARTDLAGSDLACWCPLDEPCHGDILLTAVTTHTEGP